MQTFDVNSVPRRVLFIHGISELGGAETDLLALLKWLDRSLFSPFVVCPASGPFFNEVRCLNVPTFGVSIPPWRKLKGLWQIPMAIFRLTFLLKSHRIELVHVNDFWWCPLSLIAARFQGVPCVVHIRQQIEPLRIRQYWLNKVAQVLAVSKEIYDNAIEGGMDPSRLRVLYSGIDCKNFQPRGSREIRTSFHLTAEQPVIGAIGNLFPRKGYEYLLGAISLIKRDEPKVHCLIVGEGDPKYRMKLQDIVRAKKLDSHVTFVGFQKDVVPFLSAVDIFVLPSIMEGFGIVLLEAMAVKKPVVASRVGGIPESVQDGKTGILVTPGSSVELAEAILKLILNPTKRKEMGTAGRDRVETHFDITQTVRGLQSIYGAILDH